MVAAEDAIGGKDCQREFPAFENSIEKDSSGGFKDAGNEVHDEL